MSTRRQVAEIMMNRYFQEKDLNSMVRLIRSGFVSKDSSLPFLDIVTKKNSGFSESTIDSFLDAVGPEHFPSNILGRPSVKVWYLSRVRSLVELLDKRKWTSVSRLPKYTMNPLLHELFRRHMVLKTSMASLKKSVRFLLKKGATMNSMVANGGDETTILQNIVFHYIVGLVDERTFHQTLDVAIQMGANPKKRVDYFYGGGSKRRKGTLLHYYCFNAIGLPFNDSVYNTIPTLVRVGVPVNALDSSGDTALHYVAKRLDSKIYPTPHQDPTPTILLEILVQSGALIDIPGANGRTVRKTAPSHGFLFTVSDLHRQTRSGTRKRRRS